MPKTEKIDAYWFALCDRLPHGDNRKIEIGKTHSLKGDLRICEHALHASRNPFDALGFAPGPYLYKVRCWGDVIEDGNKLGCRRREYVAVRDATEMLRQFAREMALSVIHLWDAPDVVRQYLQTGDDTLRATAYAAANTTHAANAAAAANTTYAANAAAAYVAANAAAYAAHATSARERFNELVVELFAATTP